MNLKDTEISHNDIRIRRLGRMIKQSNTKIVVKKLEDLTETMVGHKDLHEARFKIFEAINILNKFHDDMRLKCS